MAIDDQFGEEIVLALACAGFSAHLHEYDVIREVAYEQVKLMKSVLRTALQGSCAFVEKPEPPAEGHADAVWIGTTEHIFRVDLSNKESAASFRAEILRPAEITDLAVTAINWFGDVPSSDSTLAIEFSVRGRQFKLAARSRNCEQLRKLLEIVLHRYPPTGSGS